VAPAHHDRGQLLEEVGAVAENDAHSVVDGA
jgi:hypothetical protein